MFETSPPPSSSPTMGGGELQPFPGGDGALPAIPPPSHSSPAPRGYPLGGELNLLPPLWGKVGMGGCHRSLLITQVCEVRRWKLTQVLYQGHQGAGRPTGYGDRGFRINEL